jgi:hypothetical protein
MPGAKQSKEKGLSWWKNTMDPATGRGKSSNPAEEGFDKICISSTD